jgi:uncharacterized RDD family membrane protein YckC
MAVTSSNRVLARPATAEASHPVARVNARVSAYLLDSLVLLVFILAFFIAGGAILLFTSDLGGDDPPDSAYYAFIAVFLAGTVLAWSAFNLALLGWRGQTAGMYVVGIRAIGDDGLGPTAGRTLLRWFGLHPLLFHPLLLPLWGIGALVAVSITLSQAVLIVSLAFVLLCLVAPVVSLGAMLLDPERRTISDRLARTLVVYLDRP